MKDNTDPDDGKEIKIKVPITANWQKQEIDLTRFTSADMKKLYVVAEFVFEHQTGTVPNNHTKHTTSKTIPVLLV